RYRWDWFPVVDEAGRFVGLVREQGVRAALARGDAGLRVEQVAETEDAERWRIGEEQSLQTLLGSEPLQRFGALVAVDAEGVLRGVVTMDQARRALQAALAPRA
ncbi:MAG: CBS domain-containing protein, partial [Solirubrobacteraceae bacterium]